MSNLLPFTLNSMTLTYFLIYSLATWRIASLLVRESGPWNVFMRLRELAGIEHDEDGNVFIVPDRFFAGLLSCVWCCSMWVALGWTVFVFFAPDVAIWPAMWCALSAGAILVDKLTG